MSTVAMSAPSLGLAALCLAAVGLLLLAEARRDRRLKYAAKPAASAAFVGLALWQVATLEGPLKAGESYVLAGLLLGAVGDVLLMIDGKRTFLAGLGAFLVGHIAYVVAFSYVAPPELWLGGPTPFVLLCAAVVLKLLWRNLGDMRGPVIVYVATITVMVAAAFAVYRAGAPDGAAIAVGSTLFAVSDVAVARERFVSDTFSNKAWGLPLYYVGQLLLASTIGV